MKRLLITGATGFVGKHIIKLLQKNGEYEIYGTYRKEKEFLQETDTLHFVHLDLLEKEAVKQALEDIRPDSIIHLAAQANVSLSVKDPIATFHTNIDSQLNLFQSLRELEMGETKVLVVSSAEVYGHVKPDDLPVDEETPHRPANPYAVSKIAQDYLGFQYHLSYGLPIVRVRPFNHIGPGQSTGFVVSDFAKQVAEIEKGVQEPVIKVGNLKARRDFTDVRDIVKAYALLLEKGVSGEVYNAGSGVSHSAQEILDLLIEASFVEIRVEQDPNRMRPSDIPEIRSDNTKIEQTTGWKPEIPFEQTIKDTLDYWRSNV